MTMFSATERAALDRATVPAIRPGLAGDIVAAVHSGVAAPRRPARGGWRRHGRVLLGAGALVVASATAAATGLLDRLPIRIPGITRVVVAPAPEPKHVVRAGKPREAVRKPAALGTLPQPAPSPSALPPPAPPLLEQWRERRAARIAAGLPVRPPLIRRALAAKLRAMPPAERRAAIAEWRRIKALPPEERKLAVARVKADYLAQHPRMAQRYERRLEARSARAASSGDPAPSAITAPPSVLAPGPRLRAIDPAERVARRAAMRERRIERRAWRLRNNDLPRREGPPIR